MILLDHICALLPVPLLLFINVKTYQFEHNVKEDQIIRKIIANIKFVRALSIQPKSI
jgi:hypothetical protein